MRSRDDHQAGFRGQLQATTAGMNRRRLLEAAGGLVLSASGLLLPAAIEDAGAREGANGGKLGGRRRNDRRGRSKNRDHGDKKDNRKQKDKNDAPGSGLLGNIVLSISNIAPGNRDLAFSIVSPAGVVQDLTLPRNSSNTFNFKDDSGALFMPYFAGLNLNESGFPLGTALFFNNPAVGTPWVRLLKNVILLDEEVGKGRRAWEVWPFDFPERRGADGEFFQVIPYDVNFMMNIPFTLHRATDSPSQWIPDKNFNLELRQGCPGSC